MLSDEQLVARAQKGDQPAMTALVDRFQGMTRGIARTLYAPGLDREDLDQEALIGLCKAWRDWRPGTGTPFARFANLVVLRQCYTAVKTQRRGKHEVLSWASRAAVNDRGDEIASVETVEDARAGTAEILATRAQLRALVSAIANDLSPLERESIIGLAFLDESYLETEARILAFDGDRPGRAAYSKAKVVDNALSRARRKLAIVLAEAPDVPLGRAA